MPYTTIQLLRGTFPIRRFTNHNHFTNSATERLHSSTHRAVSSSSTLGVSHNLLTSANEAIDTTFKQGTNPLKYKCEVHIE